MDEIVYKVCDRSEWVDAQQSGTYLGAPVDLADGYIHFSTANQLAVTLAKHFAGRDELVLVAVDAKMLGDALRWEVSRGGDLFPHLYADLKMEHVAWTRPMPLQDGKHVIPDLEAS